MALNTLPVSYTNVEIIFATFPELGSAQNITNDQIVANAGMVEARMNAFLSKRYDLPFTSEFPVLRDISTDLTIYRLLVRTFAGQRLEDSPWPDRYKEANEDLEKICQGIVPLIDTTGTTQESATTRRKINSSSFGYDPTFTELDFSQAPVDTDKLNDERDAREELL